ncbi:MAG: 30S ribosomal protein S8 [Planctomycetes bacterium]|nr:30S ribosomal protein S8 [Planctomycetota bacterium]
MMTDPIADMLTRMRNALARRSPDVLIPGSRLKVGILEVLKREGYIDGYQVAADGCRSVINVKLRYGNETNAVISSLSRFSTPGCRRYRGVNDLPKVRGGLGIAVVSTNQGILSDRECRQRRVGGEVLCTVD